MGKLFVAIFIRATRQAADVLDTYTVLRTKKSKPQGGGSLARFALMSHRAQRYPQPRWISSACLERPRSHRCLGRVRAAADKAAKVLFKHRQIHGKCPTVCTPSCESLAESPKFHARVICRMGRSEDKAQSENP